MRKMLRGTLMAGLLTLCGLGMISARAVGPEVRDNAGLFSASAVKQADETIRVIQRDFRKDLLVETFPGVPDTRTNDYARNRESFFTSFVQERAQAARLDGIYVLVMKEAPPHRYRVQVGVGQTTRQRAFVAANREELVRLLQSSFREDKYDEGLRTAVTFVERTMRSNLSGSAPAAATPLRTVTSVSSAGSSSRNSGWSMLVLGLFIVGGIFLFIFFIRMLRNGMGGSGTSRPGGWGGGGGGGLFSSLLGGIGGAIAGSWLYDQFTGNAHAGDHHSPGQADAPPSDVGSDFNSSGGDVDGGNFAGGSDFGSSGGDVGGGDFGGGGGDA